MNWDILCCPQTKQAPTLTLLYLGIHTVWRVRTSVSAPNPENILIIQQIRPDRPFSFEKTSFLLRKGPMRKRIEIIFRVQQFNWAFKIWWKSITLIFWIQYTYPCIYNNDSQSDYQYLTISPQILCQECAIQTAFICY
mgnify:CR=1 FL=1